jgi:multidrug resistance efflux pump
MFSTGALVDRTPAGCALDCAEIKHTAAAGGYLYSDYAEHFETTDDAFIAARQFAIAPKVPGYLTAVPVTDNQHVPVGGVIARVDERDYRIALEQAQAQVASAEANIQNIDAQVSVQNASRRQPGTGEPSAGGAGVRQAAGGALPVAGPKGCGHLVRAHCGI